MKNAWMLDLVRRGNESQWKTQLCFMRTCAEWKVIRESQRDHTVEFCGLVTSYGMTHR